MELRSIRGPSAGRARAIVGLSLLLFALPILTQSQARGQTQRSPREIVEEYCRLDAAGGNFDSRNPNFRAIGSLLVDPNLAAYDTSVIIRSFRVGKSIVGKRGAKVDVMYSDVGILAGGALSRDVRSESVVFRLRQVSGSWKIDGLRMLPHISREWMLAEFGRESKAGEKEGVTDQEMKANFAKLSQW